MFRAFGENVESLLVKPREPQTVRHSPDTSRDVFPAYFFPCAKHIQFLSQAIRQVFAACFHALFSFCCQRAMFPCDQCRTEERKFNVQTVKVNSNYGKRASSSKPKRTTDSAMGPPQGQTKHMRPRTFQLDIADLHTCAALYVCPLSTRYQTTDRQTGCGAQKRGRTQSIRDVTMKSNKLPFVKT